MCTSDRDAHIGRGIGLWEAGRAMRSPFLDLPDTAWVSSNALAFAIRDRFPVSPRHTLVVPRREVATWFDAT